VDAGGRWQILRLHVEDQVPLAALARDHGLGVRTLERWHARYRAGGLAALDRTPRADVGGHRLPAELVTLIEGLGLTRPRPPIAAIHRTVVKVCAGADWPVPSYGVVRSIITALDPGMVTLALEGPGSYRDKYELAVRRAADRPNAMWQADHTLLDIVLVGTDGKPARPWLTVVMDDCSRAICGYMVFFGAPATMNTALALRQAIWHKSDPRWPMCGIPEVLYVDHGSDFTSDHLARTTVDLHIRLIHSAVARPQGRGKVERFFGTVNTELLTTLPGHLHHGAGRWPAPALSLADLDGVVGAFVLDYNDRTHSELGISPRAAWIADGWLPRTPDSLQALDGLLLSVARSRTVRRDGVHFQGLRYVSPTLAGFVGRPRGHPLRPQRHHRDPRLRPRPVPVRRRRPGPPRAPDQPQGSPGRPQRPPPRAAPRHQRADRHGRRPHNRPPCQATAATDPSLGPGEAQGLQGGPTVSERFIVTKEHRRFTEFADSVRRGRTIGLCFGPAGVGKTVSARRYAHWDQAHELVTAWGPRSDDDAKVYAALAKNRTALYTPGVLTTPRLLREDLDRIITRTSICIQQHLEAPGRAPVDRGGARRTTNYVQLVIVDESERLSPTALELLRDRYDRDQIALILIGMPGLENEELSRPVDWCVMRRVGHLRSGCLVRRVRLSRSVRRLGRGRPGGAR